MNLLRLSFAALFLLEASSAQSTSLQRALQYFGQERYAEALQEFETANKEQPQNAAVENAIGITESKLGRIEDADKHYVEAIRLNGSLEEAHKNLGFNYLNSNRFVQAEAELKTALRLKPGDPYAHLYLTMVYVATFRDRELVEHVTPSLPLLPNDPAFAFQLAKACLRSDHPAEAISILETLRKEDRLTLEQRREIANLLFEGRCYPEAAEQFRKISALDSGSWESRFNLAVALVNAKQPKEAITALQLLATERKTDTRVLGLLGYAYEVANQMPQALEAYRSETQADPLDPNGYLDYTRLLMDLSRLSEAEQFVHKGLEVVREPYPLYMRLGSIQMMASKYDQAREWFRKAIGERPEIPVGYVALAQICFKTGQNEEAAKVLEDARTQLKPDFLLEYYYGLSLDRLSRKAEATAALERAVNMNDGIAEIHFELGRMYFETDRLDPARKEMEKAIKIDPHFAKSYVYLSRIYARLGNPDKAHQLAEQARQYKEDQRQEIVRSQETRLRSFQPLSMR